MDLKNLLPAANVTAKSVGCANNVVIIEAGVLKISGNADILALVRNIIKILLMAYTRTSQTN